MAPFHLGVLVGLAAGAGSVLSAWLVYPWARRRWGPCVCEEGRIRVGDGEVWEWSPCPFCRAGERGKG